MTVSDVVEWVHFDYTPFGCVLILASFTCESLYLQMHLNHAIRYNAVSCILLIGRVPVANGSTGCITSHRLLVDR